MRLILLFALLNLPATSAFAEDLKDLVKNGYAVFEKTNVDGEFEGCDYDKRIRLTNGLLFVCSEYRYSYSYRPEVLILKHIRSGDFKVLINEEEYDGEVYHR